ncbi:macrophage mannose receptor 1-like [Hyla sarda]|uniref:macrophage mannose receptor 1-like n=1 Tax=Hyla sarda TaxID=327740 RepID=UPI0024C36FF8|nr:macrophage mannose receptor 1-like [Hyla sarda]
MTSSGPSPGAGMTSSGPGQHLFSGPTPSSALVVTTSRGNTGSRTTQGSSGPGSGELDGNLHLVQSAMTWSESRTFCRTYYTDLASISSDEEQSAIAALLFSHIPSNGFWFGLKRNRFWGNWYWSNGRVWGQYSFWGESEPSDPSSKLCGLLSGDPGRNFSWSSACCGADLPFVCY